MPARDPEQLEGPVCHRHSGLTNGYHHVASNSIAHSPSQPLQQLQVQLPQQQRRTTTQSNMQSQSDEEDRRPSTASIPRRPSQLARARSEYNPSNDGDAGIDEDQNFRGARHGFDEQYSSEDVITHLANSWQMYFTDKRHETTAKPQEPPPSREDWRMTDRLKTVSAALAVCLNLEVEPPDQLRTTPGARMEAWVDPSLPVGSKALELIGKNLQSQYETLSIRARYKQYLDPSIEETRKFCQLLRRNAKDERVLFHYNGHGVPKPTPSGEIWVFNKNYTQYIPISLFDLQAWLQGPTIYVWDCSDAGNIIPNYERFIEKHENEDAEAARIDPKHQKVNYRPYIHLAACKVGEHLPTNPNLPADLFTCCLTSPIHMALHYFALQNPLHTNITPERARKLPGRLQERRTPLGELNWIFTAIADTIAWTTLPRDKFRQYFRQDLMVASLYRNFILAQRIMATYGCHPQSFPELPDTRQHELWKSWDWAVEMVLSQLDDLEAKEKGIREYEYKSSTFFQDQLSAFNLYLDSRDAMKQRAPEQLPCVLQVLLSQHHRIRALTLLSRFLDLGPWAVKLALSIGIFPYVLKLLQSVAVEVRPVMIFIWSRILSVDNTCQIELVKDPSCLMYFARLLRPNEHIPVEVNVGDHKAMCAFIITMICRDFETGQRCCNSTDIMNSCLHHLHNDQTVLLRQWACLCLSQLWQNLPEAKWRGIRENALTELTLLMKDPSPEVRASMIYALTTFIGIPEITPEVQKIEESLAWTILPVANDASPVVRKEFLVFVSTLVVRYESKFIVAAFETLVEEDLFMKNAHPEEASTDSRSSLHYALPQNRERDGSIKPGARGLAYNTVFAALWKTVLIMSVDPHVEVQEKASMIVDYVMEAVLQSTVGVKARSLLLGIERKANANAPRANPRSSLINGSSSSNTQSPTPGLLRRTASMLFPLGALFGSDDKLAQAGSGQTPSAISQTNRVNSMRNMPAEAVAIAEESGDGSQQAHYNLAPEPTPGLFEPSSTNEPVTLPLQSTILEWSIEHWRQPKMWNQEADEPGSIEFNERLWRKSRNENILKKTQPLKAFAGSHKWSNSMGIMNNNTQPVHLSFHQFEDHLAVADDGNTVTVWDWKKKYTVNRFSNGNPIGSKIRDLRFINEDDQALLMLGSSDGVIRVYRDYDNPEKVQVASAWRALTDMVPSNVNSGMALDWQQVTGRVLVAGDVRVIRAWDVDHEVCAMDIPARSGSCVTSLTSDQMTGNTFVAGFGDGAVRAYDVRMRPQDSMVRKWREETDRQWVMGVHMQRGGQRELLSASRNGKVRIWDLRMDKPMQTFQTTRDTLRTISLHEHLPVFSVGTSTHNIKVFNLDGQQLSRIEPYSNFLQQTRNISVSATDFHPHRPILAASAWGDTHINLYTCENQQTDSHA